ncbi:MAG: hypothetical protein GY760_29145 [Deltaproteobacteria bacterium]|nr:hypothetical protein [Deltaproteobacteria bacterium]
MNALQTKLNEKNTEELKTIAFELATNFSDEAVMISEEIDTILLNRLDEQEFIKYSEILDEKMG